jgi:xanthine dehydrogenase accessory factor
LHELPRVQVSGLPLRQVKPREGGRGGCRERAVCSRSLRDLVVGIKGAGEMASAVAWRLYMANIRRIFMMEVPQPLAVRRGVSFSEAVQMGSKLVEGVEAVLTAGPHGFGQAWEAGKIAVIVDPRWSSVEAVRPDVLVDAILAKRNLGTSLQDAPLVIGLGPGFSAGGDVHLVIETNRGHNLGRIIEEGSAEPDTGVPGEIAGFSAHRVLRAPASGVFEAEMEIGHRVRRGDVVGFVRGEEVKAGIDGVIRGLIAPGTPVEEGLKLGDVDPRGDASYCDTISDKARAIAGSVLEAILRVYNV